MSSYSFGIPDIDKKLSNGISKGSNIMVIGPPLTGKHLLARHIIYNTIKENNAAILVTTRDPGEDITQWFTQYLNEDEVNRIGVVDCITKSLGKSAHDTENIKYASSPVDLTGIGVKISQFFEQFIQKQQIQKTILCIDSVSTILMYTNIQTLFRFLHVFTGRVKVAGAIGLYIVDKDMHEEKDLNTLKQLFSGLIEIKTENENNYLRLVGMTPKPTEWQQYEIDGINVTITPAGGGE